MRRDFVHFLRTYATPRSDFEGAELIFGELLANAITYAPGTIDVSVDWQRDRAVLTIMDAGKGFTPCVKDSSDPLCEGGRGLQIVSALSPKVVIDSKSSGTQISAMLPVWRLGHPAAPEEVLRA